MTTREALHYGFDALYVAFQGSLSAKARSQLEKAKSKAVHVGKPVYAVICDIEGHVGETGAKGGYKYRFEQGPMSAKWLVKDNDNPLEWNLFAEIPAIALAEFGVEACVQNLYDDLKFFDARIISNAVNRFDVAVDIMDDNFVLRPENISVHSHTKVKRYGDEDEGSETKTLIVGGSRIETVTIGQMPNRQVTIYDKRKQVIYSQKSHWWEFWGREKSETKSVWRVELRFGKKYLKRVGIETIEDMLTGGGDLVAKAFEDIKYLNRENHDGVNATRSKLDDFWTFARDLLVRFARGAMPNRPLTNVREVVRKDHERFCRQQIVGYFKNIAATRLDRPDFPDDPKDEQKIERFISELTAGVLYQFSKMSRANWADFEDGIQKVRRKYHYLERRQNV